MLTPVQNFANKILQNGKGHNKSGSDSYEHIRDLKKNVLLQMGHSQHNPNPFEPVQVPYASLGVSQM